MQYVLLYFLLLGWMWFVLIKTIRDSANNIEIEDSYVEPTTSKGHPLTNIFKDV